MAEADGERGASGVPPVVEPGPRPFPGPPPYSGPSEPSPHSGPPPYPGPAEPPPFSGPPPVPPSFPGPAGPSPFSGPPPVPSSFPGPAGPSPYSGPPPGPLPVPRRPEADPAGGVFGPAVPRRPHRWGFGAFLSALLVFFAVSWLVGLVLGGGPLTVPVLIVALTVPPVVAAVTAVLVTRWRGNGPRVDLGLVWSGRDLAWGLVYGFGGLVLTLPAAALYYALVGPELATTAVGEAFAGLRAGPVAAVTVALLVIVVVPLCEEILYRGLLWGAVERRTSRRWVPFAVTTVVFAVVHLELLRTPLLLVVSLPLALARLQTGRLGASIVAHQVNNLIPGLVLAAALLGVLPEL